VALPRTPVALVGIVIDIILLDNLKSPRPFVGALRQLLLISGILAAVQVVGARAKATRASERGLVREGSRRALRQAGVGPAHSPFSALRLAGWAKGHCHGDAWAY
jgi:hypothetical protein